MYPVNQALAAVIRQVVPDKLKEDNAKLRQENARLLRVLQLSEAKWCRGCHGFFVPSEYRECEHCDSAYCPDCASDHFQCLQDCEVCINCGDYEECPDCENLYCGEHLFQCDSCDQFICQIEGHVCK